MLFGHNKCRQLSETCRGVVKCSCVWKGVYVDTVIR